MPSDGLNFAFLGLNVSYICIRLRQADNHLKCLDFSQKLREARIQKRFMSQKAFSTNQVKHFRPTKEFVSSD